MAVVQRIKRNIDIQGRLNIPKDFFRKLGIADNCLVTLTPNSIVITKFEEDEQCCMCGTKEELKKIDSDELICKKCQEKVIKAR